MQCAIVKPLVKPFTFWEKIQGIFIMTRNEQIQLMAALDFLKINHQEWDQKSPQERRLSYRKKIMSNLLEHHPDRQGRLQKDDPVKIEHERITKLLNGIDYAFVTMGGYEEIPDAAEPSDAFSHRASSTNDFSSLPSPKNGVEFNQNMVRLSPEGRLSYYEFMKEKLPNIIKFEEGIEPFENFRNTIWRDYKSQWELYLHETQWIDAQVITRFHLKNYNGADDFVSAFVSKDRNRIKLTFDSMVSSAQNEHSFMRFFRTDKVKGLIHAFCEFKPIDGGIYGIQIEVVLLLCQSLALNIPYHLIDPQEELDQELIRTTLTAYVLNGPSQNLIEDTTSTPTIER